MPFLFCLLTVSFALNSFATVTNSVASTPQNANFLIRDHAIIRNAPDVVKAAIGPQEIIAHYNLDKIHQKWTGKGQHIAILNYDKVTPQILRSVSDFFSSVMKTNTQVVWHGEGSEDDYSPTELEVDVEMAGLFAPDAIIDVYSFSSESSVTLDFAMGAALLDPTNPGMKIFSSSWSPCEGQQDATLAANVNNIITQAANNGVTMMFASGDEGLACNNDKEHDPAGRGIRSWPTGNPYITAAGATSFYGPEREDVAWRFSGGGPSKDYPMPYYQVGKLPNNYHADGGHRGISDIAMLGGDPGIRTWSMAANDTKPGWYVARGTSYASPEFAGFIALVNQARLAKGLSPVGALNHRLYCMSEKNLAKTFKAITQVDPQKPQITRTIAPGAHWNPMTGLGSPRMPELLDYLSSAESDTDESCVAHP